MLSELHLESVILHIINMVILFLIVRFLVYKPLRKFMQARTERIAASLSEARQANEAAEGLRAQYEQRIAAAEDEARARALEITGAANASARTITENARTESRAIIETAQAAAKAEREKALAGLRGEVIDLATGMAAQILRKESGAASGGEPLE